MLHTQVKQINTDKTAKICPISVISVQINMDEKYLHKEITSKIINCFYTVYNTLGYGFLEKVYENSLMIEL